MTRSALAQLAFLLAALTALVLFTLAPVGQRILVAIDGMGGVSR